MAAHRDVLGFLAVAQRYRHSGETVTFSVDFDHVAQKVQPAWCDASQGLFAPFGTDRSRSSWFELVMVHKVLQHVGWGGAAAFGIDRVDGKTGSFEHALG